MNSKQIQESYSLGSEVAFYLSHVGRSQDFKDYENSKQTVSSLCDTSKEYEAAMRCLTDIMDI